MNKFEEMSDTQINNEALILLDFNDCQYISVEKGVVYWCQHDEVDLQLLVSKVEFDPCNNPNDAWSIILANGINIEAEFDGNWSAAKTTVYTYDGAPETQIICSGENPLRAAVIVFLMINSKCDGNHDGPKCSDPECWNDDKDGE